jgi:hypothetical protein
MAFSISDTQRTAIGKNCVTISGEIMNAESPNIRVSPVSTLGFDCGLNRPFSPTQSIYPEGWPNEIGPKAARSNIGVISGQARRDIANLFSEDPKHQRQ